MPVLLAAALAAKLLSVGYLDGQAAGAFASGDQASVASAASGLGIANFVERHKAPFAAGDALVLSGDYAGARTLFEASLEDAAPADECKVRVNLVLSIERLADRPRRLPGQGDAGTDAAKLYDDGLAVVKAAPPGCFSPGRKPGQRTGADGEGDRLREAEGRLQAKADELGTPEARPRRRRRGAAARPRTAAEPAGQARRVRQVRAAGAERRPAKGRIPERRRLRNRGRKTLVTCCR